MSLNGFDKLIVLFVGLAVHLGLDFPPVHLLEHRFYADLASFSAKSRRFEIGRVYEIRVRGDEFDRLLVVRTETFSTQTSILRTHDITD